MTKWGRDKHAGQWIPSGPHATIGAVLLAAVTALVIGHLLVSRWTPIQRALLPDYVKRSTGAQFRSSYARSRDFMAATVYDDQTLTQLFQTPLYAGCLVLMMLLPVAILKDLKRGRERRLGRRTKGTELLETGAFNRRVNGDGFRIQQTGGRAVMLPRRLENSHTLIAGDTGTGKSTLISERLDQIAKRR